MNDKEMLDTLFAVLEEMETFEHALVQANAPSWQTRELSRLRDKLRPVRIAMSNKEFIK